MMTFYGKYAILLLSLLNSLFGQAQIYLQIEKFGDPKTIKFREGDYLWIKTAEYPDTWQRKYIYRILANENTVVFDDAILQTEEIREIKIEKPAIRTLGNRVIQFGISWFIFAAILEVTDRYDIGTDTGVIGGSAIALGFGIKGLFSKKRYKMGKNSRVRLLDLNLSSTDLRN